MWDIACSLRCLTSPAAARSAFASGSLGWRIAFVIVLFASAINRSSRDDTANNVTQATSNEPSEPLAELGVAPGASDASNTSNNSAASKK